MSVASFLNKLQKDVAGLTRLVLDVRRAASGEANTASNIGAGGVGFYDSKIGVDLRFRNLNAASARLSVALDNPSHEVDIDVVMTQLDHGSMGGLGDVIDHLGYVTLDGTRALTGSWDAGCAAGRVIRSGYLMAGAAVVAMVERLQSEGRLALKETTDPAADAGYGKLWASSVDGLLYYIDDAGNIYDLTAGGEGSAPPAGGEEYFKCYTTRRFVGAVANGNSIYEIGALPLTLGGTKLNSNDNTSVWVRFQVGAANSFCRSTFYLDCRRNHNPTFYCRFRLDASVANTRIYIGLSSAALSAQTDEPNAAASYVLLQVSPTFANFRFMTNAGAGSTNIDSGLAVAVGTAYDLVIDCPAGGNVTFYITPLGGATTTVTTGLTLPAVATDLGLYAVGWCTSGTTYFHVSYITIESD